ncbi:MAG: adenine deaminase [Saprospiraceae bacterium]|nr:MAG: adenine deaminase [Saprospiraceae bacterium]
MWKITGRIVDIPNRRIFNGELTVKDGRIVELNPTDQVTDQFILPGFVDAHVHIESSMLVPSEFARLAVVHGTVATVSDPHEIANVLGIEGVHYMINNGAKTPFKFNFGAPSCVPATGFESAGATIDAAGVAQLLELPEIRYLAEMMNYPGVLYDDEEVFRKLAAAKACGKPIDGHAPGLRGDQAKKYISAGITTDHECFTYEEGLDKLKLGMKVLIREGSAAKNFNALIDLLPQFPDRIMFCSDDKHPDDLIEGHINQLAARALAHGCDLFDILRATCINPVAHYGLEVGQLRPGDPADFIITDELEHFKIKATYINGQLVAKDGQSLIPRVDVDIINQFNVKEKKPADFHLTAKSNRVKVIKAINGEIVTESFSATIPVLNGVATSDLDQDILLMAVVNRYKEAPPALAFIHGFKLKKGAIASCVGHDSHNIIAVGVSPEAICSAVNAIIRHQGGISAVYDDQEQVLPLPVAGIMSPADGYEVANLYARIDQDVKKQMGSGLTAPYMTLSFMALLVIPELKLSDKGLFDGKSFTFVDVFE